MTKKRAPPDVSNPSKFIGGKPGARYGEVCTPDEMIDAVKRAHGIARDAAAIMDCTRRTVMAYINRYPEVKQAYTEAREENVDVAENRQLVALNKGARWAIENWLFYSKEGRERGWLRRAEQGQDMNLLNAIQIIIPDNARDGDLAAVDVTQAGDDGEVRQYTYATTLEEARHQKQIAGLPAKTPGSGTPQPTTRSGRAARKGTHVPRGNDAAWLNVDDKGELI